MKEVAIGRACSTYRTDKNALNGKHYLEVLGVDGTIMLEWSLEK
jgi:hypothetical protein